MLSLRLHKQEILGLSQATLERERDSPKHEDLSFHEYPL
jgi:hypothetical protein